MKVIIIGDVVGKPGRKILVATLQRLKEQHEAEFVVAMSRMPLRAPV